MGLYISKPGYNVLTCTIDQLLFTSEMSAFQVIQSGVISFPETDGGVTRTVNVSIASLGFLPVVLFSPDLPDDTAIGGSLFDLWYTFPNSTTLRVNFRPAPAVDLGLTTGYALMSEAL